MAALFRTADLGAAQGQCLERAQIVGWCDGNNAFKADFENTVFGAKFDLNPASTRSLPTQS
jgi:hypothetical protein